MMYVSEILGPLLVVIGHLISTPCIMIVIGNADKRVVLSLAKNRTVLGMIWLRSGNLRKTKESKALLTASFRV